MPAHHQGLRLSLQQALILVWHQVLLVSEWGDGGKGGFFENETISSNFFEPPLLPPQLLPALIDRRSMKTLYALLQWMRFGRSASHSTRFLIFIPNYNNEGKQKEIAKDCPLLGKCIRSQEHHPQAERTGLGYLGQAQ